MDFHGVMFRKVRSGKSFRIWYLPALGNNLAMNHNHCRNSSDTP